MIAWAALTLALLNTVFLLGVTALGLRAWSKVAPQLAPLLSMFAPSPSPGGAKGAAAAPGRVAAPPLPDVSEDK